MLVVLMAFCAVSFGGEPAMPPSPYEVVWDSPSQDSNGTMPLGNGEIALNAWIEPSGDLRFYIGRTDSWDDNGRLLKIGSVRIKFGDGPADRTKTFRQVLTVKDGTLSARYGEGDFQVDLRLWVDANRPVICVEAQTAKPSTAAAMIELWRNVATELPDKQCSDVLNSGIFPEKTVVEPDTVLNGLKDRIGWYHRNIKSVGPALLAKMQGVADFPRADPLLHRTFGAVIATGRLQRVDDRTLRSTVDTSHLFEIAVQTKHPATVAEWLGETQMILDTARKVALTNRRAAHEKWWADFWRRSWIHIAKSGEKGDDAAVVSRGYALQRYMSACAGRGRYPIKFNGSLFTVPTPDHKLEDADFRLWGPGYWWQNTRLPYYSMCAAGDFEMMEPLFNMYARDLMPFFKYRTQKYLGHGGAYIPECIYFWGDVFAEAYGTQPFAERADKLQVSEWHKYEWVSGPELVTLLLDRYAYTEDEKFLRETALPAARELLGFFDKHYKTGGDGKLDMQPSQALETWVGCVNPMPELAGLHATTSRLLALPENLTTAEDRAFWRQLQAKLPSLPTTKTPDGKVMLAPAQVYRQKNNSEVPELYAVFPFRQIAVGKPHLEWGVEALNRRTDKGASGWRQDDIFMAWLGETAQAREYVVQRARSKHEASRFPAFWGPNFDWIPDQDHGSVLLVAVQSMLLQADGRKIYLLPAWPKDWDCEFKLHAPYNTTVEGVFKAGKLEQLKVAPASRRKDVEIMDIK
jgi:alpha-L-fucosidase 2